MNLAKKLAQQQLVKTRNEARMASQPKTVEARATPDKSQSLPATSLRSSLEKLRNRTRRLQRDQASRAGNESGELPGALADLMQGNDGPSFLHQVSHSPLPLDGPQQVMHLARLIRLLCAQQWTGNPQSIVFLDTETTGLSGGAGTVAFLIGVGRWSGGGFVVEQYLMRDYHEERAMLVALQERLAHADGLVTFNGKAFDLPLLQSRFVLARQRWPLDGVVHLDLLHPARRIWQRRLGDCSLANLESHILGIGRQNDIPGRLIPQLYFRYVRTQDPEAIAGILRHNRWDIETLARLAVRMGEIFSGQSSDDLVPLDLYSAGKYAGALGEQELAVRWSEAALLGGLPDNVELEAKKAKASRLKRERRYTEAADLWQALSESSEGFLEDVHEELAIYYEHRKRDLAEALRLSESALAQLRDQAAAQKWKNRRARVARKLARCCLAEPGRLFDRQS